MAKKFTVTHHENSECVTISAPAPKERNMVALQAILRSGAGQHTDRKLDASRKACRKPIDKDGE